MSSLQRSPELADAYLDGLTAGMQLAETYQEDAAPRFHLSKLTRRLVLLVLAVSLLGWLYGSLEVLNVVPQLGGHAPQSCTFDGGGTIASGDAARTSQGTEWVCTDGTLVHVTGYGN